MSSTVTRFLGALAQLVAMCVILSDATLASGAEGRASPDQGDRPRIGLALAGGGAKGGAHVGVLRVLEANRVPIDYIAGTSIGSIVGGLYAMGMTPDEIEAVIDSVDWIGIFADVIAREDRSFRRKTDDDLLVIKNKPGFSDGELKLPLGLIQGQKIDLLLSRLTLPVATIDDFDELNIPFRAVATDITNGRAVVLGKGSLARSIRASMSIPGFIAPMKIDGKMLVDGGVANNLPIDVVRQMGADIVIAVDISTPLKTEEELSSVLAITAQLSGILTNRGTEAQIETLTERDRLISVPLGDLGTADFGRMNEGVALGATAAEGQLDWLHTVALSEQDYGRYRAARTRPDFDPPRIDSVRVANNSDIGNNVLDARTPDKMNLGEPLDVDALESNINRVYGMELFQNVRWDVSNEDGEHILDVEVDQRAWGPDYLQFGLVLTDDLQGEDAFSFTTAYTRTAMNPLGGELRVYGALGESSGLAAEFYQPLEGKGKWFVVGLGGYQGNNVNQYRDDDKISEFRVEEYGATLATGRELGAWGELRAGIRRTTGEASVQVGEPAPNIDVDRGQVFARFTADKLDNVNFPSKGTFLRTEYVWSREELGGDADFQQILVSGFTAKTIGEYTYLGGADYFSTLQNEATIESQFGAGGLFNLSGFEQNQLFGQNYARLAAIVYRTIRLGGKLPVFTGLSLEFGNVFEDKSDIKFDNGLWAGSVWLGSDTFVGPIYLAYGRAEGGDDAYYLLLGRTFGASSGSLFGR